MNLRDVMRLLDAELLTEDSDLEQRVETIQASDLMSDVLTQGHSGALLITGLVNAQAVRTAEVVDLVGVVFARGKRPAAETVALAGSSHIPLMATNLTVFEVCGRLYANENGKP